MSERGNSSQQMKFMIVLTFGAIIVGCVPDTMSVLKEQDPVNSSCVLIESFLKDGVDFVGNQEPIAISLNTMVRFSGTIKAGTWDFTNVEENWKLTPEQWELMTQGKYKPPKLANPDGRKMQLRAGVVLEHLGLGDQTLGEDFQFAYEKAGETGKFQLNLQAIGAPGRYILTVVAIRAAEKGSDFVDGAPVLRKQLIVR
jgi:hypothetical protein